MFGWLLVNHFVASTKFDEIYEWLLIAAKNSGIHLQKVTNSEVIECLAKHEEIPNPKPDFVLFWDKDTRLAYLLEKLGLKLFNSASAIDLCDDKARTFIALSETTIKMPKTLLVPKVFQQEKWSGSSFVSSVAENLSFPVILKECYGSFGEQVYFIENEEQLSCKLFELGSKPALVQEFIASNSGKDLRLSVVGNAVVATMFRHSANGDFRANISNGGKMKEYAPTDAQIDMAIRACQILGLDFGGVDLLLGENDTPILCEVNSNAHFKNIFACTGVNVADYILRHVEEALSS